MKVIFFWLFQANKRIGSYHVVDQISEIRADHWGFDVYHYDTSASSLIAQALNKVSDTELIKDNS